MTRDDDTSAFPARFAEAMMSASEDAVRSPQKLAETAFESGPSAGEFPLERVRGTATFKARVQSGGRINSPDANLMRWRPKQKTSCRQSSFQSILQ